MTTTNKRFREVSSGVTVEMIAGRIVFDYIPDGLGSPQHLKATWWGREYLPVGDGYQTLGEQGNQLETVLEEHATTVRTVTDPVTGEEVTMSTAGAVTWLMDFYDHAYNLKHAPPPELVGDPVPYEGPVG